MIRYILTQDKTQCCGCRACEQICPVEAFRMEPDEEGFLYPVLRPDTCIDCGLCAKACPMENAGRAVASSDNPAVYACWSNDPAVRTHSSSGGLFSEIAATVLQQGGSVFGAAFDPAFRLRHERIGNSGSLDRLRGSKYLQSDTGGTFAEVCDLLKAGHPVYYTGTPCQIAGLKLFLRKPYPNLTTSDLICHGVPSQKIFDAYKSWLEQKHDGRLERFSFRKLDGWGVNETFTIGNRRYRFRGFETQPYSFAFLSGMLNRPACYHCPFTTPHRTGDITLADFWGVERFFPAIDPKQGVSLILVNTAAGEKILERIAPRLSLHPSRIEDATLENGNLTKQTAKPASRDSIYAELDRRPFDDLVRHEFRAPHRYRRFMLYHVKRLVDILGLKPVAKKLIRRFQ